MQSKVSSFAMIGQKLQEILPDKFSQRHDMVQWIWLIKGRWRKDPQHASMLHLFVRNETEGPGCLALFLLRWAETLSKAGLRAL